MSQVNHAPDAEKKFPTTWNGDTEKISSANIR